MKKYLVGFVVGVVLTVSTSVVAEQASKVGKKITEEYTVKLDGKELPVKAVAFDGTSYAPLRAVGDALGLEVGFENREVLLNKKVGDRKMAIQEKMELAIDLISQYEERIADQKKIIEKYENLNYTEYELKAYYDELNLLEGYLSETLKQKEKYEKELNEVKQ